MQTREKDEKVQTATQSIKTPEVLYLAQKVSERLSLTFDKKIIERLGQIKMDQLLDKNILREWDNNTKSFYFALMKILLNHKKVEQCKVEEILNHACSQTLLQKNDFENIRKIYEVMEDLTISPPAAISDTGFNVSHGSHVVAPSSFMPPSAAPTPPQFPITATASGTHHILSAFAALNMESNNVEREQDQAEYKAVWEQIVSPKYKEIYVDQNTERFKNKLQELKKPEDLLNKYIFLEIQRTNNPDKFLNIYFSSLLGKLNQFQNENTVLDHLLWALSMGLIKKSHFDWMEKVIETSKAAINAPGTGRTFGNR